MVHPCAVMAWKYAPSATHQPQDSAGTGTERLGGRRGALSVAFYFIRDQKQTSPFNLDATTLFSAIIGTFETVCN